jgi:hypothetical protein
MQEAAILDGIGGGRERFLQFLRVTNYNTVPGWVLPDSLVEVSMKKVKGMTPDFLQ